MKPKIVISQEKCFSVPGALADIILSLKHLNQNYLKRKGGGYEEEEDEQRKVSLDYKKVQVSQTVLRRAWNFFTHTGKETGNSESK